MNQEHVIHLWILIAVFQLVVLMLCIFGIFMGLDIGGWPVVMQLPLLALMMLFFTSFN